MLAGSILQQLRDIHQSPQAETRPLNFGVYYKNTLVALCHALEDAVLGADYQPLMITAFQRGKWYLQEAERYGEIADRSRQIVILAAAETGFAEHPTSQKPNVDLISLSETDPVAQEWHLIIVSPNYTAMVLCQELSEADYGAGGIPSVDLERKFYGFWTFEPKLVVETAALAIEHVGRYNTELQQKLTAQVQEMSAQMQQADALCGAPTTDHLGEIVARVVDYLHTEHESLQPSLSSDENQLLDRNLVSNELQAYLRLAQLMDQADLSNPFAAAEVATLSEAIGQLLDLPAWQIHRLRLGGLLHRLAVLSSSDTALSSGTSAQKHAESPNQPLSCPLMPGIQVLRKMQQLRAVATILTHQNEWWDGSGQPAGLTGDEIPLEARILALASAFQHQLASHRTKNEVNADALSQALEACRAQQGERWDPKLVEVLGLLVSGLQQGLNLSATSPKIASGLWLVDSHGEEVLPLKYLEELKVQN